MHIELKQVAKVFAESLGFEARFEIGADNWRADILITNPKTKGEGIVEIQLAQEAPDIVEDRMRRRLASGRKQIWFFAHDDMLDPIPERVFSEIPCMSLGGIEKDMPEHLRHGLEAWLSGKLKLDTGATLKSAPVDILTVPVLCQACGTNFEAPQYAVARASVVRPDLSDVVVHVSSRAYQTITTDAVAKGLQVRPGELGEIRRRLGPSGDVCCPRCQQSVPEVRFSKNLARRAPRQTLTFLTDIRSVFRLRYPRWRDMRSKEVPVAMSPEDWAKEMIRLTSESNHAAGYFLSKRREEAERCLRAEEERKRQEKLEQERKDREGEARVTELRILVEAAVRSIGGAIDVDAWMASKVFIWRTPADVARLGWSQFDDLKVRLNNIIGLSGPDAEASARLIDADKEAQVGLPIDDKMAPWRKKFKQEIVDRCALRLEGLVMGEFKDQEAAATWLNEPNAGLGGLSPAHIIKADYDRLDEVIQVFLRTGGRWLGTHRRRRELFNLAVVELGRSEAQKWMLSALPGFPELTPAQAVVSESGLETCRNILLGSRRRRK